MIQPESIIIYVVKENFLCRRYTKFYGNLGDAAADIARDAILGNFWLHHMIRLSEPQFVSLSLMC